MCVCEHTVIYGVKERERRDIMIVETSCKLQICIHYHLTHTQIHTTQHAQYGCILSRRGKVKDDGVAL